MAEPEAPTISEEMVPAKALKKLILAYVNLLEIGRDRIVGLGGTCDPVDVMEAGDPSLRAAKEALTAALVSPAVTAPDMMATACPLDGDDRKYLAALGKALVPIASAEPVAIPARLMDDQEPMACEMGEMTAAEDVLAWLLIEKIGCVDDRTYTPHEAQKIIAGFIDQANALPIASAGEAGWRTDETGWLIEQRGNVPCWWDGRGEWTTDSLNAIRFARKIDAEVYIDGVGWTEAFASEHIWTGPKP